MSAAAVQNQPDALCALVEVSHMTLAERIPNMTDAELASLHVNALRLSAGDSARNREATELLPALEAEVSARKVRRSEAKASEARRSKSRAAS